MAPNKMKGKHRVTQTTRYKRDLENAITRFMACPAAQVNRITFEDMRSQGRGAGFAREGGKRG